MRAFFVWLFFLFVGLSAVTFLYMSSSQDIETISNRLPYSDSTNSLLNKIEQEILTSSPLKGSLTDVSGTLSIDGVLQETNKHRVVDGASSLTLNTTLNEVATAKLEDMFAKQYFEHVSPDDIGPGDLADNIGYQYIRVGENLALGNYQDDAVLVQAWMDSPGHRDNILHRGYSEIGIAVGRGEFKDSNTWLAVQTFGLPTTACPEPDSALRASYEDKQIQSDQLSAQLDSAKQQLTADTDAVNELVAQVNELTKKGNDKIKDGNEQIKQGNEVAEDTGSQEQAQPYWDKGKGLQKEGELLLAQAKTKQELVKQQQVELEQLRSSYNDKVNIINQLGAGLKSLVKQLNEEIKAFNACAE